jgi:xylulokinase
VTDAVTELLLTVDLGTTNCKAQAFTLNGRSVASASVGYATRNPRQGWYEQRISDWQGAVTDAVRAVAEELGPRRDAIAGLALTAWGPGLVLLDAEGEPLNDLSPTWQDTRSTAHGQALLDRAGPAWIGGGLPLSGFPAKLAWALDNWPAVASAAHAAGVKDYLVFWLTGSLVTEPSSGPFGEAWSEEAFAAIGWDRARLPEVVPSTSVVGALAPGRAASLGLRAGLPVLAGLNDGAAATLGVGAHAEGDLVVSLGTNGVLRFLTRRPPDVEACLRSSLFRYPLLEGVWVSGGFVLSGGSALAWLAAMIGPADAPADIEDLLAEAAAVRPGSDGVVFLPYLVGRGSPRPDPDAAAAFHGLRNYHRRGHLTRAVLEGVAFGVKEIVDVVADLEPLSGRLFVTGGGATSSLWRSIVGDVLKLPTRHTDGDSNRGAAVVLAIGLGLASDLDDAVARLVPPVAETSLSSRSVDEYALAYAAYSVAARADEAARS